MIDVAARVALGVVFAAAGATKVVDRTWPGTAARFGLARVPARLVPPVELVLGALLVAGIGGAAPTVAAIALLGGFTIGLLRVLRRGEHPPCACFGGWSRRPSSWRTVARNVGLGVLGVVALSG